MNSRNWLIGGGIVVILIAIMAGVLFLNSNNNAANNSTSGSSSSSNTTSTGASNSSDTTQATEVDIQLSNFKITPATLTLHAGEKVKFVISSDSGPHSFNIDELSINSNQLSAGDSQTIEATIPADAAGKVFRYYCGVDSHAELGMEGTLTISN